MSESSEIPNDNMEILKEALRAQQAKLQKVYFELEEERDASSSAASEAMLKILRLQAQKAQVKMEASQYKREAEEKMCFAEESLNLIEDLMNQKDMDIANLEFQVQAYTNKLLAAGCSDLTIPDDQYPDTPDLLSETASQRSINNITVASRDRRSTTSERERFVIPTLFQKKSGSSNGALNAYREQIRRLGDQVNKISDDRFTRRSSQCRTRTRSCSVPPLKALESSTPPTHGGVSTSDFPNIAKILVAKSNSNSNSNSPSKVKDF